MPEHTGISEENQYDIVIVGGGVYGAVLTRECARAGYSTVLIEKDEFCNSTSANSLNILHGGLRYLQHLDLRRMRRSIYSRRYFQKISPTSIDAIPFLTPLQGWGIDGPIIMRTALLFNDLISIDRNTGLNKSQRIHAGSVLSRKSLLGRLPKFSTTPANGAALWYESVMNNAKQLVNDILYSAEEHGAVIAKNTEAIEIIQEDGILSGLCCKMTKSRFTNIKSKIVIDTTGKTTKKLGAGLPGYQAVRQRWARAVNLLIDKNLFNDYAMGLKYSDRVIDRQAKFNSGNRHLFFVPRQKGTAIGTFYESEQDTAGNLDISTADQQRYLDAVNSVLPEDSITEKNISGWQSGWLPVDGDAGDELSFTKASTIISIESKGIFSGLIEVRSVKFTTAPAVARDVMKIIKKSI